MVKRTRRIGGSKLVIQNHHIRYEPKEVVVPLYKGEHFHLTRLGWRKNISLGFCVSLQLWLDENFPKAKNLRKTVDNQK